MADLTNIKPGSNIGNLIRSQKLNNTSLINPAADDDSSLGYEVGSKWTNMVSLIEYVCTNADVGIAVWKPISTGAVTVSTTSTAPAISGAPSAPAGSKYYLSINNYDQNNIYTFSVSSGTAIRISDTIIWTLGLVAAGTASITVSAGLPGNTPVSSTQTINITSITSILDGSIIYDSTTMTEFTKLVNFNTTGGVLTATTGSRSLKVLANEIYDTDIDVGNIIDIDGVNHKILDKAPNGLISQNISQALLNNGPYISSVYGRLDVCVTGAVYYLYGATEYFIDQKTLNVLTPTPTDKFLRFDFSTLTSSTTEFIYTLHMMEDGTTAYILSTSNILYELHLNVPYDLNSSSITKQFAFPTGTSSFVFSSDGSKIFVGNSDVLTRYDLSINYDISTMTIQNSLTLPYVMTSIAISSQGKTIFITSSSRLVYSFTFTIANDILSSYTSIDGIFSGAYGIALTHDHKYLYLNECPSNSAIYCFNLDTEDKMEYKVGNTSPMKSATIVNASLLTKRAESNIIKQGLFEKPFNGVNNIVLDGKFRNFSQGSTADTLNSNYPLYDGEVKILNDGTTNHSLVVSNPSVVNTVDYSPANMIVDYHTVDLGYIPRDAMFSSDGLILYTIAAGYVFRTNILSTAYDITTITSTTSITLMNGSTAFTTTAYNMTFDNTGTVLYVGDPEASANTLKFTLTTPYDITTYSYNSLISGTKYLLTFNLDGTKMFYKTSGNLYEVDLSTPYDITTTGVTLSYTPGYAIYGISFNSDFSRLYILDGSGVVQEYDFQGRNVTDMTLLSSSSVTSAHWEIKHSTPTGFFGIDYTSNILHEYKFTEKKSYRCDTSSVTNGATPVWCCDADSKLSFDFGNSNGYVSPSSPVYNGTLATDPAFVNMHLTYNDLLDSIGGMQIQTKVKTNYENEQISNVSGVLSKIV